MWGEKEKNEKKEDFKSVPVPKKTEEDEKNKSVPVPKAQKLN